MKFQHRTYLPTRVSEVVDAELRPREQVLWSGQPIPGRLARRSIRMMLFGIVWTAFSLFWILAANAFKPAETSSLVTLFPFFGVPFVLVGFGMLSSPLWMRRRAKRMAYVITDQRVMILIRGSRGSARVYSFAPAELKNIRRVQNADGTGDLLFEGMSESEEAEGRASSKIGFLAIGEVRRIEDLLRSLANSE